jgi:hypothetical protein
VRIRALHFAGLLLATTAVAAQDLSENTRTGAEALRDAAMRDTIAYELVESLTMEVGPRSAGSDGDKAAVVWAVQMLQGLGFVNVRTEEVDVPHWDRGALDVQIAAPFPQTLVAASLGGSPGTEGEVSSAEVIRVTDLVALRALSRDELGGKIVYVDHRMQRARDGKGYGAASRIRSCAHYIAAERGARATLIRSAGTSEHRVAHTGSLLNRDLPATIPAIALANADADMLSYQLESGQAVTVRLRSTARFLAREKSANVIGEIPGEGKLADEIVLLAAHLDSWDLGTGAIDDGAGVAILTAAAKMILDSGNAPRRTIRVVLYANEEFGTDGEKQYARNHRDTVHKHVVGLEADSGAGRVWRLRSRVGDDALGLVAGVHALLAPIGIEPGDNKASGGADLSSMRKAGMPVLELTHDDSHYFDFHHTADDTLDKIDRDDLNQGVAAYVTAVRGDENRVATSLRRPRTRHE